MFLPRDLCVPFTRRLWYNMRLIMYQYSLLGEYLQHPITAVEHLFFADLKTKSPTLGQLFNESESLHNISMNSQMSTQHVCTINVQDKIWEQTGKLRTSWEWARTEGFIFVRGFCLWHFHYIEENATHCACLSAISMSRHSERCCGGVSLCTVILVSRFTVFCTFCLLLLRAGQQHSAPVHPHSVLLFVCFTFTLHFPTSKNIYYTPRIHFHSNCGHNF